MNVQGYYGWIICYKLFFALVATPSALVSSSALARLVRLVDIAEQCSRLNPSYEFHFEGLSNLNPSVEGLVQTQDVNPRI
jgi:hypothetical protein